jgi:hypothetical protein
MEIRNCAWQGVLDASPSFSISFPNDLSTITSILKIAHVEKFQIVCRPMNQKFTSPARNPLTSSSSQLSPAFLDSCDFINRSAERRNAFALARDSLALKKQQEIDADLSPDSVRLRHLGAPVEAGVLFSKKKLDFQAAGPNFPNLRRVCFGSVDVRSITPRSNKIGAVGIAFELEDDQIVVRSVNPGGPAAEDGRIVPGDLLVEGE